MAEFSMVDVTVVLGVHAHCDRLISSLESVRQQQGQVSWECLVVANAGFQPNQRLAELLQSDSRLRVLESPQCGLTSALALGCQHAHGTLIARLDVGDVMAPRRLHSQAQAFSEHPDLVLATSDVEICGPAWEHLRTDSQPAATGIPQWVNTLPVEQGISIDIPHHASVMFSREAYESVGGYRTEFYFGQDWDLWYRLASKGTFVHLPDALTRVRLFTDGLSSRHWREQREIARLSLACYVARNRGQAESVLLHRAAAVRPNPKAKSWLPLDGRRAEGAYFIAEALRRNGDRRCRNYFKEAFRFGFWKIRIWVRSIQSLTIIDMGNNSFLTGKLKCNIGCGQSPTLGFLNFDSSPSVLCGQSVILTWFLTNCCSSIITEEQRSFILFCRTHQIRYANAVKRLPLPRSSCSIVYASHVIEHLTEREVKLFMKEAFRILAPGGILRLAVPDLQVYINQYNLDGDATKFLSSLNFFPSHHPSPLSRIASTLAGNRTLHKWAYNKASLHELLTQTGFAEPVSLQQGVTTIRDPGQLNLRERSWESLYMEATKPDIGS